MIQAIGKTMVSPCELDFTMDYTETLSHCHLWDLRPIVPQEIALGLNRLSQWHFVADVRTSLIKFLTAMQTQATPCQLDWFQSRCTIVRMHRTLQSRTLGFLSYLFRMGPQRGIHYSRSNPRQFHLEISQIRRTRDLINHLLSLTRDASQAIPPRIACARITT